MFFCTLIKRIEKKFSVPYEFETTPNMGELANKMHLFYFLCIIRTNWDEARGYWLSEEMKLDLVGFKHKKTNYKDSFFYFYILMGREDKIE